VPSEVARGASLAQDLPVCSRTQRLIRGAVFWTPRAPVQTPRRDSQPFAI